MNLFQILALLPLLYLSAQTLRGLLRSQIRKRVAALWLSLWLGTASALLWPKLTVVVAKRMGIGRGADLVLYISVVLMLVGFFYIYTRFRRLDRQLTQLVRSLAVESAKHPQSAANNADPRDGT